MQFLYSNVLLFMLIPAFILMFLIVTKKDKFSKYFDESILEKLSLNNQFFSNKARNITLFLALIFMIIALARPVTNEKTHESKQETTSFVIAIDISKSMLATDIYPNRLELAKKKLNDIIDKSIDNSIAVTLFAKSSFIVSPLTQDFKSLKILIDNLNTGSNFDNGTNIYSTLELSKKLLQNSSSKNLILLTDGADKKNFKEEIEFAKKENIKIYTIAIATKKGAAIKEENGNYLTNKQGHIVTVKLNENIKKLSLESNGAYITYSLTNSDIDAILNEINSSSKKDSIQSQKHKTYTELFYYPLALGIFFLLIAFSSLPKIFNKSTNSFIILTWILFICNNDLKASVLDFQTIKEANKVYEIKNYKEAIKKYSQLPISNEQQYNLANAYYKNGEYEKAITSYLNVESENRDLKFSKLHNLGNSYVKINDLLKAKKSYENALKIKNDKQTKENLDLVNKALEKNKNKQKDKNQEKSNKEKKKQKNKQNKPNKNSKKEGNSQNKESKENKKENNNKHNSKKLKQNNQENNNKNNSANFSKNELSQLEEEKWLKSIKQNKTDTLLKKFNSSKKENTNSPW